MAQRLAGLHRSNCIPRFRAVSCRKQMPKKSSTKLRAQHIQNDVSTSLDQAKPQAPLPAVQPDARLTISNLESLASLNSMDLDDLDLSFPKTSSPTPMIRSTPAVEDTDTAKRLLWGRLATLGLGAVLLAERMTGQGVVQYISDTGAVVTLEHLNPILALLITALIAAALLPTSRQRMADARMHVEDMVERVQAWWGRAACLSLASVLSTEMLTGEAVLELLGVETGVNTLSEPEAVGMFLLLLLLTGRKGRQHAQ